MQVEPYLFFNGRCEEALNFYRKTLGADVTMLLRYKEQPGAKPECAAGYEDKIMHAAFSLGGARLMASDDMADGPAGFKGFSLSIQPQDESEAKRLFDGLSDGGHVRMPLGKTFFSPCFGMVTDRFGVSWMVVVEAKEHEHTQPQAE